MSSIAAKVEQERELGRLVSIHDEIVKGRGHQPTWSYGDDGDDLTARAECVCGQSLACRVYADGRAWSAGRLRVAPECTAPE